MTIGWFSCAPTASSVRFLQFISIGYINLYLLGNKILFVIYPFVFACDLQQFCPARIVVMVYSKSPVAFLGRKPCASFWERQVCSFCINWKTTVFFPLSLPPFCTAAVGKCRNKRWAWSDIFDSLWVCFLRFSRLFFFFCVVCCRECSEPYLDVSSDFSCAMLIKEIKFDYDKDWSRTDVCRWTCVLGMRREKSSF